MKNKKAVSLMISYVILISIAITISIGVYAWLKVVSQYSPAVDCKEGTSVILESYNCYDGGIELSLKNNGRFNVDGIIFVVGDNAQKAPLTYLISGDLVSGDSWPAGHSYFENPLNPGNMKDVIFLNQDIYGEVSFDFIEVVQIQPFIIDKKSKDKIVCMNAVIKQKINNCNIKEVIPCEPLCSAGEVCNNGVCCAPDCIGKECGSDGCGGSCGTCDAGETCNVNGQCVALSGCTDTDGGLNYYVKGTATDEHGSSTDICLEGNNLWERYCIGNLRNSEYYACPSGSCENGACISEDCTPQTCLQLGKQCGDWDDGCGTQINCGTCNPGDLCNNGVCEPAPYIQFRTNNLDFPDGTHGIAYSDSCDGSVLSYYGFEYGSHSSSSECEYFGSISGGSVCASNADCLLIADLGIGTPPTGGDGTWKLYQDDADFNEIWICQNDADGDGATLRRYNKNECLNGQSDPDCAGLSNSGTSEDSNYEVVC